LDRAVHVGLPLREVLAGAAPQEASADDDGSDDDGSDDDGSDDDGSDDNAGDDNGDGEARRDVADPQDRSARGSDPDDHA
jgi:hypothetical protein